ncbi:MAG: transposase, partial [Anaerolineales bacterium]
QRKKLERLCRYVTRPAIAEERLSVASSGDVIVTLKTPYDDGTTHVVLSPMEFMGRLAALVPRPRVNLTRFHGVFSPNSKLRRYVVPAPRAAEGERKKPRTYALTWAQRLRRVFAIEIEKCDRCGGPVKIIASIEDPAVIQKILEHLGLDRSHETRNRSPPAGWADPATALL